MFQITVYLQVIFLQSQHPEGLIYRKISVFPYHILAFPLRSMGASLTNLSIFFCYLKHTFSYTSHIFLIFYRDWLLSHIVFDILSGWDLDPGLEHNLICHHFELPNNKMFCLIQVIFAKKTISNNADFTFPEKNSQKNFFSENLLIF